MRRFSLKRQKLNRDADAWREEKIMLIGRCDLCGMNELAYLCLHEIARGINRELALTAAYAQLCLCDCCHRYWAHRGGKIAEQLARLKFVRPYDYDIEEFYRLTDRRWPDETDIEAAFKRIAK